MKITQIEIFDIHCPKRPAWSPVFVRIHTDEGLTGVGEAGLAYDLGHSAAAHMIKEFAKEMLLGIDPFATEHLWNRMLRESFWGLGGGPVVYSAMSAIDTALWDIKGKAIGLPVYQLLGGKTNKKLRTYASQLQFDWDCYERKTLFKPEDYAKATEKAVAEGYDAVKVDPMMFDHKGDTIYDCTLPFRRDHLNLIRARMQAIRDVLGENGDIIFECHSLPGLTSALQLGEIAEEFNCLYFEEPVNYLNSKLHEPLKQKLNVPIAAGERLYLRHGVREYLEKQTVDVLQPDIGLCGGLTEAKKICDYADMYDVKIQAHVCGGPVATAASLHLETAIPNFIIHEHHTYALKDFNRELCLQDPQPVNGFFEVSETPGLGIELNDEVVMKSPRMVIK
ncbi:mandelate racemase/muconate lactonizing enzyme family protein [Cysteiniphilum sp. QT6929]|uniref:mandelate racemase/muconate lactonizing enzyme family protein n=1 Tax=Cysteiniphilum sp. QT6929 TaxID=2975055 RepID=UPI0024B39294|nr:mandelate racemase/muconate lactonizing enzyme family protein [Cysteiniphilum sp. QT6929]WHN64633.1 mandelate racemase/muconate lactonizing enzyme family protein [Cysteiniphilum sp. QT6929]